MKSFYLQSIGMVAMTFANTAYAQETSSGNEDIVVTAQKRTQRVSDVPMSISVASGDELEAAGVKDVGDLVKITPGLNYTKGSFGLPVYTIRGIGYNDTSISSPSAVSLYQDEFVLPVPYMATGANFDVERVEVLKGPQGILFGQNSTGGAINFVANKPTDKLEAGFDVSVGRFSEVIGSAYVSGPVSDSLRARVFVRKEYSGPWQESVSRDDRIGRTDKVYGRVLVDWDAAAGLKFSLGASGWQDHSDTQAAQFLAIINPKPASLPAPFRNLQPTPERPRAADWDPNSNFNRDDSFWHLSLRGDYEISSSVKLTSLTSYDHLKVHSLVDVDGLPFTNFTNLNTGRATTFAQEVRLSGDHPGFHWLIGANYQRDDVRDQAAPTTLFGSAPFRGADARGHNLAKTYSAFGNLEYEVAPRLTLQGGLRYSRQKRDFAGCLYDTGNGDLSSLIGRISSALTGQNVVIPPGGCVTLDAQFLPNVFVTDLDEDNVSWKVGVSWKPTSDALLYANVSRGYKNGAFATTGATFYTSLLPARQESVLAYEAGFKVAALDRKVQLDGAVFYNDFRDKQIRGRVPDATLGLLARLLNVPKSRIYGAELLATLLPFEGMRINLGGTYVNAKIDGTFVNYTALGQQKDLNGDPFPLTPKWQLTGSASYERPITSDMAGFVTVGAYYQGKTNAAVGSEPLLRMKDYVVVDATLGLKDKDDRWRVEGYVRNIANTYYYTNVVTTGVDVASRYAGAPRTYGIRFSYRYF